MREELFESMQILADQRENITEEFQAKFVQSEDCDSLIRELEKVVNELNLL